MRPRPKHTLPAIPEPPTPQARRILDVRRQVRLRELLQKINDLEADTRRLALKDDTTTHEKILLKSIAELAWTFGAFLEDELYLA
jgi:hypothetical protein